MLEGYVKPTSTSQLEFIELNVYTDGKNVVLKNYPLIGWVLAVAVLLNVSGCSVLKQLPFVGDKPVPKVDPMKAFYSKSDQFIYLPSEQTSYFLDFSQWGNGVELKVLDKFASASGSDCKKTAVFEQKSARQLDVVMLCRVKDDYWLVNRLF